MNLPDNQKQRGGYYTPSAITDFLTWWALAQQPAHILEPSCGDGRFLASMYQLLQTQADFRPLAITAVELMAEESAKAHQYSEQLRQFTLNIDIINTDFFNWITNYNNTQWEAIIGNPPYIRYRYFENEQRAKVMEIFQQAQVPFTKRTNAWVAFIIASITHLAPRGRLAMVIPAEILHIQHANGLRLLLEQAMQSVTLIHFRQMVFDEALQGVVLLLAEKRAEALTAMPTNGAQLGLFPQTQSGQTNLQIIDLNDETDLLTLDLSTVPPIIPPWQGHWMFALLDAAEIALLNQLQTNPQILPFTAIAKVTLGIVTGANDFFVVNDELLKRYQLETIASPMLAKSDLIKGISYTQTDHDANRAIGKSVHFLQFPSQPCAELLPLMAEYIAWGEMQELHTRYKCRIRSPWYVVPYVWVSEIGLLKRCHHFPRLVLNELGAYSTDTAYRITLKPEYQNRAKDMVFSFLNSLTFLYAELLGRHYGGGVLELVPSEIAQLFIPLIKVSDEQFNHVDQLIRAGVDWQELLDYTDELILKQGLGLSDDNITTIRKAHQKLMRRRLRVSNEVAELD